MNEERTAGSANEHASNERCLCREVVDHISKVFDVPPAVREHLTNSRVEFLKAIRAVIDQRIEHLSSAGQRGSHIAVE